MSEGENKIRITSLISEADRREGREEARVPITPLSRKDELKKKVLADILKKIEDRAKGAKV